MKKIALFKGRLLKPKGLQPISYDREVGTVSCVAEYLCAAQESTDYIPSKAIFQRLSLLLLSTKMNLYHLHGTLNLQTVLTTATLLLLQIHVYLDKSNLPFVNVCCLYLLYYIKVEIELQKNYLA